jgi:hypothetical protein
LAENPAASICRNRTRKRLRRVDRDPNARAQIRAGQMSTRRYDRTASDTDMAGDGTALPAQLARLRTTRSQTWSQRELCSEASTSEHRSRPTRTGADNDALVTTGAPIAPNRSTEVYADIPMHWTAQFASLTSEPLGRESTREKPVQTTTRKIGLLAGPPVAAAGVDDRLSIRVEVSGS